MENRNPKIKSKMFSFLLSSFFFFLCSSFFPVNAEQKAHPIFSISPIIINITISPGKTYEYDIRVKNLLKSPLPIRASLDNLQSPEDEDGNDTTAISPLLSWISLEQKDMIIPANEEKKVHLTVKIPGKVPIGGYYGTIFLEPLIPFGQKKEEEQTVQAKVGVILLANIGIPEKRSDAQITKFAFDKFLYEKGPVNFSFRVKNQSLYHFSAKPFLSIKPLFGHEQRYELGEKIILPGKGRSWSKELDLDDYVHGIYFTTLAVSVGNGEQIIKKGFFLAFPISSLAIAIIIIVLVYLMVRYKKRVMKFFKILFEKR